MQAVVSCMDVSEVPEKLVIDMGANAYRQNLMYMMSKVRCFCHYPCRGLTFLSLKLVVMAVVNVAHYDIRQDLRNLCYLCFDHNLNVIYAI